MPLTASQRVHFIREIARRLSTESYTFLDLVLEQFGFSLESTWSGSPEGYIVACVKGGSDKQLLQLARHVGIDAANVRRDLIEPAFWQPGLLRVFLSHISSERHFAAELQRCLLPLGISTFVAHNDIEPTAEWIIEIEAALMTADALLAILHPGFHASSWTDQEIGIALGRGIPVFSVKVGIDPYGFAGRYQAFQGAGKSPQDLAAELFQAYSTNKSTAKRLSSALVARFEHSGSFADAKLNISRLEQLQAWDAELSERVLSALQSNPQISDSWGVPQRVKDLIAKHSR